MLTQAGPKEEKQGAMPPTDIIEICSTKRISELPKMTLPNGHTQPLGTTNQRDMFLMREGKSETLIPNGNGSIQESMMFLKVKIRQSNHYSKQPIPSK